MHPTLNWATRVALPMPHKTKTAVEPVGRGPRSIFPPCRQAERPETDWRTESLSQTSKFTSWPRQTCGADATDRGGGGGFWFLLVCSSTTIRWTEGIHLWLFHEILCVCFVSELSTDCVNDEVWAAADKYFVGKSRALLLRLLGEITSYFTL